MQRHKNDTVERLPVGHADVKSPLYVPLELRAAFSEIDDATELAFKKELWTTIAGPMMRKIAGKEVYVDHRSNDADFATALCWLKVDEAGRRVRRASERADNSAQNQRLHTCRLCGQVQPTAVSDSSVSADRWCEWCRAEVRRQEVAEHAARMVNGKSVGDLIAAARSQAST